MTQSKRILMIDDDKDHLLLCKWLLERHGYELMTVTQASRTVEIARKFKPGLIFIDHYMGDSTGTEITKMVKADPLTRHIPVIYFSSCEDIVKRAEEAGADAYLAKPFQFEKFIELTRQSFNRR